MFCPNCGTRYDEEDKFCAECGTRLFTVDTVAKENIEITPETQTAPTVSAEGNKVQEKSFWEKFIEYDLPEDAVIKLPIPSYVLKFIKMGIWTFLFFGIFFSWAFIRLKFSLMDYSFNESDSANLIKIALNGKSFSDGIGFLSFVAILALLVILGVIGVQVANLFISRKLPVPQLVLCAAPGAITFFYMICAWISSKAMIVGHGLESMLEHTSAGPGFGAWFIFVLSGIETAAFFLFIRGKKDSLLKV